MTIKVNLVIEHGAHFSKVLELYNDLGEPFPDLESCSYVGKIKKTHLSSRSYDITCTPDDTEGTLTLEVGPSALANADPGRYVYDVMMTDTSNTVTKLIEGIITLNPTASR